MKLGMELKKRNLSPDEEKRIKHAWRVINQKKQSMEELAMSEDFWMDHPKQENLL